MPSNRNSYNIILYSDFELIIRASALLHGQMPTCTHGKLKCQGYNIINNGDHTLEVEFDSHLRNFPYNNNYHGVLFQTPHCRVLTSIKVDKKVQLGHPQYRLYDSDGSVCKVSSDTKINYAWHCAHGHKILQMHGFHGHRHRIVIAMSR